ncbi:SGNH/GDSL hydrolase family protein [Leucobacter sp. UCMA 4100]|uniref:GDSL-type esterase/lipase family protein n=1 Tax=Leucobacter sp. UCMA 4100 TaxID=2810534 RepID=UPI0022EA9D87|nr:GDSL-type esterase/lipase family protein [Leucobacter sp. UCMA 4100]MDA3145867.1 SGNH/GDSL hydrolase family protein [Leucobacter sp. UCMA 4100]
MTPLNPDMNASLELPWSRYVAVGDSFTEGVGDPAPTRPNGLRGWADRVAEVLSAMHPDGDFSYANLAVRGKLVDQIASEQVDAALALQPDLITICAGGNDVLRPGSDPDEITAKLERIVTRLASGGATIVIFTAVDVSFTPVFKSIRGKAAIYNENVRAIAARHDCIVADQWGLTELKDPRYWADDRLHMNALGHHTVALRVLDALGVPHNLTPLDPPPVAPHSWREARAEDVVWARTHLVPWVIRRLKRESSGDHVAPKWPEAKPLPDDLIGG